MSREVQSTRTTTIEYDPWYINSDKTTLSNELPVVYVNGTTGSDDNLGNTVDNAKATIQAGINVAAEVGTVNVAAGTYTENLTINKSLTIQGDISGTRPQIANTTGSTTPLMIIQASDVTIKNLHFYKSSTDDPDGSGNSLVTIPRAGSWGSYYGYSNIHFDNDVLQGGRYGMFVCANDFKIENSQFLGQGSTSIDLTSVSGTTNILNNSFDGLAGSKKAVMVEKLSNADPATSGTINIEGNTVNDKREFFLYNQWIDPSQKVDINVTNNTITSIAGDGVVIYDPRQYTPTFDPALFDKVNTVTVHDNDLSGVQPGNYAVKTVIDDDYPGFVDATNNWWGTANGTQISGLVSGNVDYSPWLGATYETSPQTYYVHEGDSIQDAIDDATFGATIVVAPGAYALTADVTLDKSLTLQGPNDGISPRNGGPSRLAEAIINGGANSFVLAPGITSLAVTGLKFTNFDTNIFESSPAPVTSIALRQNIFDGNTGSLFYKFDTSVATTFDVTDNLIANQAGSSVPIFHLGNVAANSHFDNNEVTDSPGRELFNIYDKAGSGTTINNNVLSNTHALVTLYADTTNMEINGNTLNGVTFSAITVNTFDGHTVSGVAVNDNTISNVQGAGIALQADSATLASSISDVDVIGNTISDTSVMSS